MTQTANLLAIYVDNSREIYSVTENLVNSLAKKIRKGVTISRERLVGCSTMRRIISMGARMVADNEGERCTAGDRRAVAALHADYIIECAEYIASEA